ncbi:hypothetical protein TNCV_118461 [Trichonephila clavipes]|nr:hypothetical protein TNCV_118461 [Trichonephila clavipes]
MGHSVSEIVRQLGFSRSTVSRVYQEYVNSRQKTSDGAISKRQLAFTVRVDKLRNARFLVCVSRAVELREYHCLMLDIGLHVLSGQESKETGVSKTRNE